MQISSICFSLFYFWIKCFSYIESFSGNKADAFIRIITTIPKGSSDLGLKPNIYAFLPRLRIYKESQMYDYMCNDLKELKKLIADKTFTDEDLDYIEEFLLMDFNINLNSFIDKFEFQECLSKYEYYSDTFIIKK